MEEIPFMFLTCDLPPPPLFPDELRENIIPQVPLFGILNKFNGLSEKEYKTHKDSVLKRFEITNLPPFIILYIKVSACLCFQDEVMTHCLLLFHPLAAVSRSKVSGSCRMALGMLPNVLCK